HRVRHLRRDAAHGRPQGRQADRGDQLRPAGAVDAQRRLHRDGRPEGDRARDHRRDSQATLMHIGAYAVLLACALLIAFTLFTRRAAFLYRLIRSGKPVARFDNVPARIRAEATVVAGQSKLLQRLGPGLIRALIFWGFIVLFPTIFFAMWGIYDGPGAPVPWLEAQGWFALLVDVFALLVLVGVIAAFIIRKVLRPARFKGSHLREADLILLLIAGIAVTLFIWPASLFAIGFDGYPG